MGRPRRVDMQRDSQKRTPMGQRDKLTVPEHIKERGYKYRFFNDEDGRIQSAIDAGWAIVEEKTQVGDADASQASQFGSAVSKPVGGGKRGILMRIRDEWYKEDQSAKEARIKDNIQGLMRDQNGATPDQSNLYGEGIRIKHDKQDPHMPIIQED